MFVAGFVTLLLVAPQSGRKAIDGVVSYEKKGVKVEGHLMAWKDIASLTEREPVWSEVLKTKKVEDTAQGHFDVGLWCRDRGLEEEAVRHFERAVELDPKLESVRCALGREPELVERKRTELKPLAFADWCRQQALVDEEWKTLTALVVKDAWDREAIKRVKPRMELRVAKTKLRPPLAGRWKALEDQTGHHQIKCFAIYAFDFVRVDEAGKMHRGSGKALGDYFGWSQPVYAAGDGTVRAARDMFDDGPPGRGGKFDEANCVVIRHVEGEETLYGHLKKGSVKVKVGDTVKAGQLIGSVGNSGASGLPHLHFTMHTPVYSGEKGGDIGMPYRFDGFRLVEAYDTSCTIWVLSARPQEGWVMEFTVP